MAGFLGAGDLYINRIVGGIAQGWEGPFLADKFEIKANSELKEQTSKGRNTYGQVSESVPLPKPFDLEIVMATMDRTGLSMALMGTPSVVTQSAGPLTDDPITAKLDKWVPCSKVNFSSAALTVKNTAGSTTYVEGTDYQVNRRMGWIRALSTGTITDAQALKVSGTLLALTSDLLAGATQTSVRAMFKLDGVNMATGLPNIVTVPEGVISSQAAVDFLSDNFNTIPLKGRMKTPAGQTSPFTVESQTA